MRRRNNSIAIRRATLRDIETLVRHRRLMHEELHHRTPREHAIGEISYRKFIREMSHRRRFIGFLAFDKQDPARAIGGGCIWIRETQPRPAKKPRPLVPYLLSMYTEPAHRGRGVATKIVREAMRWSKKHGYPMMTLHASEMGRSVYEKLGWEQTSEMRVWLV